MNCQICSNVVIPGRALCEDCREAVKLEVARNLAETPDPAALPGMMARSLARLQGAAYTMANFYAEDAARRAGSLAAAPMPERIDAQRRFEQALTDLRQLAVDAATVREQVTA